MGFIFVQICVLQKLLTSMGLCGYMEQQTRRLHITCTTFNASKGLQEQPELMQHNKYNETSLGALAVKKQRLGGMAKGVLQGQDICLEQKSISLRQ